MPGTLRLNLKEATGLADQIEVGGGNADGLRAAIDDVKNPGNGNTSVPAGSLGIEEYLAEKRAQTEMEYGTDLECMICHDKFGHLLSGTCENCWREWMLSAKPKDWGPMKKLF
ncbi:hypothetical protein LCGC14_0262860 [marine sediment metagenome]|uniref:Uncharacterized protein n=1 Tax=marine sediment metagenome TaxID=412755 RepID=A0A0F9UI20_9ZZZZ